MAAAATSRRLAGDTDQTEDNGSFNVLKVLHEIKFGNDPERSFKRKDLIVFLRNLTTLVQNGVSLTHALETVSSDKSLKKYYAIFASLSRSLNSSMTRAASSPTIISSAI